MTQELSRRAALGLGVGLGVTLAASTFTAAPAQASHGRPIVFYVPHPDDETLSMGEVIAHHVLAGRDVRVVLLTKGTASGVIRQINGDASSSWWGGYHDPAGEGYARQTTTGMGEGRNREFLSACGQLGVPAWSVYSAGLTDGRVTPAQAKTVIRQYAERFPNAGHYGMSANDPHNDHSAVGAALRELVDEDPQKWWDVFVLPFRRQWRYDPAATDYNAGGHVEESKRRMRNAARCYGAWNPAVGSLAWGWHSVPTDLGLAVSDPRCRRLRYT